MLGPKKALKALCDQKQAQLHKGQSSTLLEGAADVPAIVATLANVLQSTTKPTMTIEVSSIELGICTLIKPHSSSVEDFKSELETKEAVIVRLQEDVQKLLCETEDKSLVIAKQVLEIQHLHWQQSHAVIMDDV